MAVRLWNRNKLLPGRTPNERIGSTVLVVEGDNRCGGDVRGIQVEVHRAAPGGRSWERRVEGDRTADNDRDRSSRETGVIRLAVATIVTSWGVVLAPAGVEARGTVVGAV